MMQMKRLILGSQPHADHDTQVKSSYREGRSKSEVRSLWSHYLRHPNICACMGLPYQHLVCVNSFKQSWANLVNRLNSFHGSAYRQESQSPEGPATVNSQ
jgi:hypothetical protein